MQQEPAGGLQQVHKVRASRTEQCWQLSLFHCRVGAGSGRGSSGDVKVRWSQEHGEEEE